ncbi:MAG: BPL-N domain-containing protein [Bdellovibrionota bacterium]
MKRLSIFLLAASVPLFAAETARRQPIALVYNGPGACDEECASSAADIARAEGLNPIFVGPHETPLASWSEASAWIQPGGKSSTVARSMSETLKNWIRNFVAGGGAYVGFCAGGFFSTAEIGDRGIAGLGIMPGLSRFYDVVPDKDVYMTELDWQGSKRHVYWEGGPHFVLPPPKPGEEVTAWPIATYSDGKIAAVEALYGKGRVSVSGPHPEAPESWKSYFKLEDPDGSDWDLARGMLRWALASEARD